MVYFISARILRDRGRGPALVISPLLALMRNQLVAAKRIGIAAATINSTNKGEWESVQWDLENDEVDMLWISPERLANQVFMENVMQAVSGRIALMVIDEVHCISDWGHDFRPDYRRIVNILEHMPPNMPVLGTTATANDRVVDDVVKQLGEVKVQRGPLKRESLALQALVLPDQAHRLAWLAAHIPDMPGTGIVYTLTKRDAESVAGWLRKCGIDARAYYSGVVSEEYDDSSKCREHLEDLLINNSIKVLVATTALGMGYDKPDVGFVVHYQAQASIVAYYQQVGRAGRNLDHALGILLSGKEDEDIVEYFRASAFPAERDVQRILDLLGRSDGLSTYQLGEKANLRVGQISKVLKFLSVERPSPIVFQRPKWRRAPVRYKLDKKRINRLTKQREVEWGEIQKYIQAKQCRMAFLQRALNDSNVTDCGRCENCLGEPLIDPSVSHNLVIRAQHFLRRLYLPIQCRVIVRKGAASKYGFPYKLPLELRASEGRAMSRWGDAGWGHLVKDDKHAGHFRDELVKAACDMIREWKPSPAPQWVTCIPSKRNPALVGSFAKRLAKALRLPFHDVIDTTGTNEPQKYQQNAYHQCKNLDGVFSITSAVLREPVLLIDDTVDSGWTFTIGAALLRQAGSGEVYPVALSSTKPS